MGVVSRRGVCLVTLVGVVVRRYIDFLILLILSPLVYICSILQQHPYFFFSLKNMASGILKMTSEAAGTRPIIFSIKSYPCMPKAASSCGGPPVASQPTKPSV